MTADHIGPISLGFIHDPLNFQACCSKCNSSKNNRLTQEDISKIISKEEENIQMISWWAEGVWNKVKNSEPNKVRKELDLNAKKMLLIIEWLKENKPILLKEYVIDNCLDLKKSYKIQKLQVLDYGRIIYEYTSGISKKKTKDKEQQRTIEILAEKDDKVNRKVKMKLSKKEIKYLSKCDITNFRSNICKVLEGL